MAKPKVTGRWTSDSPGGVLTLRDGKGKPLPRLVVVTCGWDGDIGEILTILIRGTRDGRIPARPVTRYIVQAAKADRIFLAAMARRDMQAAANRLYAIGRLIIGGGVKPVNADSTAARKGGDRRALRDVQGKDRVYEDFTTDPPPK
jgi:hypothetical protein